MILGIYKGSLDEIIKKIKKEIKNEANMVSNKE